MFWHSYKTYFIICLPSLKCFAINFGQDIYSKCMLFGTYFVREIKNECDHQSIRRIKLFSSEVALSDQKT